MKTAKIITIVCWLATAFILIGLAVWLISGRLFGINTGFKIIGPDFHIGISDNLAGPFNEVGTYTIPSDGIDAINVHWTAGDINITPYDGNVIQLTEYARRELGEKEKLDYKVSGGRLEVRYIAPGLSINITKKIEVLVPKTLAAELKELAVDATSAELYLSGFDVDRLDIQETSGESVISDITADTADVHSVSGEINITSMMASSLTMGTVSGEIKLTGVTADTLKTNTTSGDQSLSGTFKDIDAGSISGEINITSTVKSDRIHCGTTSGDVTVTLPGGTSIDVSYTTVSGQFTSKIPATNSNSAPYSFNSVSGDITIKAA